MTSLEMSSVVLTFCVLLASLHILGYLFEKMRQPPLIGEIVGGVLLGPFVLGKISPELSTKLFGTTKLEVVLNFMYWVGLILLMFISGSETRKLVSKENRKETAWILGIGTPLPFLIVLTLGMATSFIPLELITGKAQQQTSALLVLAIAVSVTSIPVISRIFYDLGIIHTRFASLILGSAVLEDIILWGVLAVASGLAASATVAQETIVSDMTRHVLMTFIYMLVGLFLAPKILKKFHDRRANLLMKSSPIAYILVILFLYTAIAGAFGINLIFAAFLAGFGVVGGIQGSERTRFSSPIEAINKVGFALFIPFYFALVGYKLNLGQEFSLPMLLLFLFGSSLLSILSVGLAARLAGFRGLDILNFAITTNARGGPGIVLASVAFEAGIINSAFYTTLVLTAVITSQLAGIWLRHILSQGYPLLSTNPEEGSSKFKKK
jgi:Kef-type K+ transport system membrane component KefB